MLIHFRVLVGHLQRAELRMAPWRTVLVALLVGSSRFVNANAMEYMPNHILELVISLLPKYIISFVSRQCLVDWQVDFSIVHDIAVERLECWIKSEANTQ